MYDGAVSVTNLGVALLCSGNLVNTGHRCDSQKYLSSDVNIIDRNIDYRSKCSLMIYGKTNVQSIAMKADRSSAMVSLNTLQTTISLNIYKNRANKFGRKTGFKINKANLRDLIAATSLIISNWIQIINFYRRCDREI